MLNHIDESQADICQAAIASDLKALGLRLGGVVMVHSSLRSLGPCVGGAETVIRGILCTIGDRGTLLMPGLSYMTVHEANPSFDLLHTPTCVGAMSEYFRTRLGTLRSLHPTHSVLATGRLADVLVADHHLDRTPVGPHSPFRRIVDLGGQILMLGCGLRPNTAMHGVEEIAQPPYLFAPEPVRYELTDGEGNQTSVVNRRHGFFGWAQNYERIAPMLTAKAIRVGPVLQSTAYLLEAPDFADAARRAIRDNPWVFVAAD